MSKPPKIVIAGTESTASTTTKLSVVLTGNILIAIGLTLIFTWKVGLASVFILIGYRMWK